MTTTKKNALGKGLGALIQDVPKTSAHFQNELIKEISLDLIEVNPYQPRTTFDEEALNEMASSIRELGIIQPITVRKSENGQYQIISGERRTRAARIAGLKTIPAYIRTANDQEMVELSLVENIQREDLDAIEIAISYRRLIEECNQTQEKLSERIGKKRATIANYLRLLKLPAEIQKGIRIGAIGMGHARALITIDNTEKQLELFEKIICDELSVRQVEEIVRLIQEGGETKEKIEKSIDETPADYETAEAYSKLQESLTGQFRTSVELKRNSRGKGKIVIHFRSDTELERILGIFENINNK